MSRSIKLNFGVNDGCFATGRASGERGSPKLKHRLRFADLHYEQRLPVGQPFNDFINRLTLLVSKRPELIVTTLSNVFTMRLVGNKTHGDLAEIAIAEFVNQFMYDFDAFHVGKDLFRAKVQEEDIVIVNRVSETTIPISLKAYGDGPLQLSTDRGSAMFPVLESHTAPITNRSIIDQVFAHAGFGHFGTLNVLPLIYNEARQQCNIMIFNAFLAKAETARIDRVTEGRRRIHPVYVFTDAIGNYICEVRYGHAATNALQRGLWTNTKRALPYFTSVTGGWIDYSRNPLLVELFSKALTATEAGHRAALVEIEKDLDLIRRGGSHAD